VTLSELYRLLVAATTVPDERHYIPAAHLLVAESQLYGVVSELLRRRTTDALASTRRAIEAAAVAYRLWENPDLLPVFKDAYPNFQVPNHPTRWLPSRHYRKAFSTKNLFRGEGNTWRSLKTLYDLTSAKSSHAGPGATIPHKAEGGFLRLSFREKDDVEIRRSWYGVMTAFWGCLKVFLAMMRETGKPAMITLLEQDMKRWHGKMAVQINERTYWIKDDKSKSDDSGLIIVPSL
jgi:hypothetical protein